MHVTRAWRWTAAFLGATAFIWASRVRNVFADADLSGGERIVPLVTAAGFVTLAALLAPGWWRARAERPGDRWVRGVRAAAGVTVAYWAVRTVQIATNDHSIGFVVVHAVLGVVLGGLGVVAARSWDRVGTAGGDPAVAAGSGPVGGAQ